MVRMNRKKRKDATKEKTRRTMAKLADWFDEELFEINVRRALSSSIADMTIRSIPKDSSLMITEMSGNLFLGKIGEGYVERCKTILFEGWNHKYSVVTYGNKMAEVIRNWRGHENIVFENTDEDGENFDIWYRVSFDTHAAIKDIVAHIINLEKEFVGQTEIALDKGSIKKNALKNEEKFSFNVLLPLFRSMGYQDVQYNHGPREFGRDITFSDIDKLGIRRNFGVQVKAGNLTGEANSELDGLIGQIDDALGMPHLNIYSRESRYITDLIIAISGKFTGNASEKICEKTQRKNVHFLDIDKIQELAERYLGTKIT